jgi:hypothetical protein
VVVTPAVGFATEVRLCLFGANLRLVHKVRVQTRTVVMIEPALVLLSKTFATIAISIS